MGKIIEDPGGCTENIKLNINCQQCDGLLDDIVPFVGTDNPVCRMMQELREKSHDFYFRLFDDLPFPMWHSGVHQKRVFFNRAWLALTGKKMEDEIGDGWLSGVYPDDQPKCLKKRQDAFPACVTFEQEYRLRRYDGEYRWIADIAKPCYDNKENFAGYIGSCHDITEHKQAEEQIQKLTQFQELVIDNANVWLDVLDEQKQVVIWNKAAEVISGYTREQVSGHGRIWEWLYPDPCYCQEILQGMDEVMTKTGSEEDKETVILTSKGEERTISWSSRILVDKKGKMIGAVALGRDVTESKRAREQLLQAQKMDAIGRLAGGVAHELNNEMSIIQGYVDINLRRVLENAPIHNALIRIRSAAVRSAHLTHQLMLSSRKQPQNKESMNLNFNIREMQEMLKWFTRDRIKLSLDLAIDLWIINGDTVNIDQVITNLVLNAKDAMPRGGVLTIKTFNVVGEADNNCQSEDTLVGSYVCLVVSDTGTGMDERVKAHLFEPFFTTKETGKGTGLGLSMAYGIIEAHGGFIDVKSEIGQGSTFRCYLPAITVDEAKEQ